jgi:hypothetical protein
MLASISRNWWLAVLRAVLAVIGVAAFDRRLGRGDRAAPDRRGGPPAQRDHHRVVDGLRRHPVNPLPTLPDSLQPGIGLPAASSVKLFGH